MASSTSDLIDPERDKWEQECEEEIRREERESDDRARCSLRRLGVSQ